MQRILHLIESYTNILYIKSLYEYIYIYTYTIYNDNIHAALNIKYIEGLNM